MNGRIYDYNLGRFMSVDPLIQSPTSTQSVNPYSYIMNNPLAGTDPTGYCSTGTHIKDNDAIGCTVDFDAGSGGSGKKKSDVKVTSNGASLVQEKLPTNLQTCEVNGLADVTAESIQHINSVSNYLEPYKLPDYVVQMAEFCRGYPCGGSGEVIPSIFVDDLLGLGLKSVILMPMKAIATHADDATAVGMRLSGVTEGIKTPWGVADQATDATSMAARGQVQEGAALYRIGTTGKSQAAEAQFWSLENPLNAGYAQRYGIPASNVKNANFIEIATLKPGSPFVTRPAPAVGSNKGGGIEVVVPENGVKMRAFNYGGTQ